MLVTREEGKELTSIERSSTARFRRAPWMASWPRRPTIFLLSRGVGGVASIRSGGRPGRRERPFPGQNPRREALPLRRRRRL